MISEKSSIEFGRHNIDFFVKRSDRRRTISLFVDPFEGVFLRAPLSPDIESLARLVRSKSEWILKKQRQIQEIQEFLPKREFVSGEGLLYLGRQFRLKIIDGRAATPKVKVKQGRFTVSLNNHFTDLGKKRIVRKNLIRWYKSHARMILLKRVALYIEKLKLPFPEVFLSNQSKRWGSCSHKGRIRFNWHIVMAPISLIDYVVAHELCHLKHSNHSRDFWRTLGSAMPDYETRRERLRKEGPRYTF